MYPYFIDPVFCGVLFGGFYYVRAEPSAAKSLSDCDSAYHDPAAPGVCENAADSDGVTAVKQHDMRSRFVDIVELLLEALLFYEHLESYLFRLVRELIIDFSFYINTSICIISQKRA